MTALRRRQFLKATGLTAGSLLLPSMFSGAARAQSAAPKRLVLVFNELGWAHEELALRRPGVTLPDDRDVEFRIDDLAESSFSRSLRPLFRHRGEMLVTENLALHSAMVDRNGDGHARGWLGVTTGAPARVGHDQKSEASMASLDHVVLSALRAREPRLTDLAAQHFAVHHGFNVWPGSFSSFHFGPFYALDASNTPVPVGQIADPQQAFDRLFAGATSTQPSPLQVGRPSVLDKVARRTQALSQRLGSEDKRKLESHHDLVRDLEQRIRTLGSCGAPTRMTRDGIEFVDDTAAGRMLRYNRAADSFSDMIAASFACDITRVATFFLTVPEPAQVGVSGDVHHEFSHPSEPANRGEDGVRGRIVMGDLTAHYATQLARLIDQLKAIPENGGSVFDNTVILWVNEISHGGHGHEDMTAVVLAGSGTGFSTGRTVRYGSTHGQPAFEFGGGSGRTGRPFNQLMVSVANAVGVDVDAVGLRSVTDRNGNAVSLTGPAPLLRG